MGVKRLTANELLRGLVRCAEFKELEEDSLTFRIWDDECRNALDFARKLGWGKNKTGVIPHDVFCDALESWAKFMTAEKYKRSQDPGQPTDNPEEIQYQKSLQDQALAEFKIFDHAWRTISLGIRKSCLLDRMLNCGEKPSQTKCPVHNGQWSGIKLPEQAITPMNSTWAGIYGHPEWEGKSERDVGCRCDQHRCGCTTGWNVDEHCGCLNVDK